MNKLTKEQQTVLNLRIVKGYSTSETARLMKNLLYYNYDGYVDVVSEKTGFFTNNYIAIGE